MKKITIISDTHTLHGKLTSDLNGGGIIIHAGDIMNSGYQKKDITSFLQWYGGLGYDESIFIAGNHDKMFEHDPDGVKELLSEYDVTYLQDSMVMVDGIKIYGSPWQPEFYNWAFNLPLGGKEIGEKWDKIPTDTGILVTHGPPQGILDVSGPPHISMDLGCSLLKLKVDEIKPKIHIFGHIHGSYGYKFINGTHFFNASVLNESYEYTNKPIVFEWDEVTNEINFIK